MKVRAADKSKNRRRRVRSHIEQLQPRLLMSAAAAGLEWHIHETISRAITMPATAMTPAPDLGTSPSGDNDPVANPSSLLPDIPPTVAIPAAASPDIVTGTSTALSILGSDVLGEAILRYQWTATARPAGSNPQFSVNGTNAAKNDTVTFDQAGNYTFTCTITGSMGLTVQSSVNVTVDQTFSSIAIQPGPPAMADRTSYPFTAIAMDKFGNAMSTQPVFNWSVADGGAEGTINSAGVYSAPATRTGVDTIHASSGDVSGSAVVTVTGDGIFDGGAQIGQPAVNGYFSDTAGTYTVAGAGASGGSADQLELPYQILAGDAVMTADVTALSGTSTSAIAGIEFRGSLASTAAYIAITRSGASGSDEIALQVRTASGDIAGNLNLLAAPGADWIRLVRSGNHFTAYYGTDGVNWTPLGSTITLAIGDAMVGGLVVSSNSAMTLSEGTFSNVSIGAAVSLATAACISANPVTTTSANLTVLGASQFGESSLTYTWAATAQPDGSDPQFISNGTNAAKNTAVTFNQAGGYTLTCTITDAWGDAITSSVNVTVDQTFTSLLLSPAAPTVQEGATQQFLATAVDQFNNVMPTPPLVWSVASGDGSINSTGLFTAAAMPGTATVSVSSGSVIADASVTIPNQPPTVAIPAAASPNAVTGDSTSLSVLGADDGGESNLTYTWSAIGLPPAPVMFRVNGTNAARNDTAIFSAAGEYGLLVTITDSDGATTSSSVIVNVYRVAHSPSVTNATTLINTPTNTGLVITPNPLDGPAQGYYQIENISGGTLFQHDGTTPIINGQFITFAQGLAGLIFRPALNSTAAGRFTVQAAATPNVSGLVAGRITATITVVVPVVAPVAHTPSVTDAVSAGYQMTDAGLVITPNPADAGEPIEFQITRIVGGSLFQSDGTTPIADGEFITAAEGIAGLRFKPDVRASSFRGFDVQASLTPMAAGLGGKVVVATVSVITPIAPSIATPADQTIFSSRGNAVSLMSQIQGVPFTTAASADAIPPIQAALGPILARISDGVAAGQPRVEAPVLPEQKSAAIPAAPPAISATPPAPNPAPSIATPPIPFAPTAIAKLFVPKARLPLRANRQFLRDLDLMQQQADLEHQARTRVFAGAATVVSAAIALLYFARVIRTGAILKKSGSPMPAWQLEDPFSILDQTSQRNEPEQHLDDQQKPELIIRHSRRRAA